MSRYAGLDWASEMHAVCVIDQAGEVLERLRKANVALCVAESEDLETPDVVTANFCYYRLRKPEYSPAERKGLAKKFQGLAAEKRDVFVYFKHEEQGLGPEFANRLIAALATA